MPGYIDRALQRFAHSAPAKPEHSTHAWQKPNYGAKVQYASHDEDDILVSAADTKHIQEVLGVILYYARTVDSTMLAAIGTIGASQVRATKTTMDAITHLLNYCATHPDAVVQYHSSGIARVLSSLASPPAASAPRVALSPRLRCDRRQVWWLSPEDRLNSREKRWDFDRWSKSKTAYIAEGAYTFEATDTYGGGICSPCGKDYSHGEPVTFSSSKEFRDVVQSFDVVRRSTGPTVDYWLDVVYDDYPYETSGPLESLTTDPVVAASGFDEVTEFGHRILSARFQATITSCRSLVPSLTVCASDMEAGLPSFTQLLTILTCWLRQATVCQSWVWQRAYRASYPESLEHHRRFSVGGNRVHLVSLVLEMNSMSSSRISS
jgi:hypothetical protein